MKHEKRILSLLLTVCLVINVVPQAVAANGIGGSSFVDVPVDSWYAEPVVP